MLGTSFDVRTRAALDAYRSVLAEFAAECRRRGARLLFVYFPAYPQIYREGAPRLVNELMQSWCRELDADFLDLTDGLKSRGAGEVLHLAPLDFHLNPAGNAAVADLVAERVLAAAGAGNPAGPHRP